MNTYSRASLKNGFSTLRIALIVLLVSPSAQMHLHAADTINGSKLYALHCAACHGNRGEGAMPGTPNFARANSLLQPDGRLLQKIKDGKNAMPGYYGILKEREILDVIAHLRTFN